MGPAEGETVAAEVAAFTGSSCRGCRLVVLPEVGVASVCAPEEAVVGWDGRSESR